MHIWPQIVMISLSTVNIFKSKDKYDFVSRVIAVSIQIAILYAGGFWDVLLK
jgi:hypothetical protein